MNIFLNGENIVFDGSKVTITRILESQGFPKNGTAVAVNNKLVRKDMWDVFNVEEGASVTVISAAFGG